MTDQAVYRCLAGWLAEGVKHDDQMSLGSPGTAQFLHLIYALMRGEQVCKPADLDYLAAAVDAYLTQ